MPTLRSPNTLPDKKIPTVSSHAFDFCQRDTIEVCKYCFLVPQNFAPCLQNYKQFNNILYPSSQEMQKKSLIEGLLVTAWSGQTV